MFRTLGLVSNSEIVEDVCLMGCGELVLGQNVTGISLERRIL